MTEAQEIRRGYEQFLPPQPPPGMYFDPASGLFLPQGVQLASRGRVAAAWFLGVALFVVTLAIGYLAWSIFAWEHGQSPAQKMLGLRCWQPEPRRLAGRKQMALRQITGFCLNGQLLAGFFIWLVANDKRSVGDFFADTVILHDPDGVLRLSQNAHGGGRRSRQEPDLESTLCHPPLAALDTLRELFRASFERAGADLRIGRRVGGMFWDAGLEDVRVTVHANCYPAGRTRRTILPDLARSLRPVITRMGLASAAELDALDATVREHLADPRVLTMPHLLVTTRGRKPH